MAVHKVLGQYKKFINGSTKLSETTFNDLQRLIQIDANDKFECSDVRIVDANSDDACNGGCFPIQQHATHFPFNTDDIEFDSNDGLLFVLIPNGRSFGIQIAYDPINEQFWMRKGIRQYVSYSATTGVIYRFVADTEWKCLNPIKEIVTGEERSTNEFIDGKEIFVKRVDCGRAPNNSTKNVPSGLNFSSGSHKLVKFDGMAYYATTSVPEGKGWCYQLSNVDTGSNTISVAINGSTNDITIKTANDRSSYNCYVNLYYTKEI